MIVKYETTPFKDIFSSKKYVNSSIKEKDNELSGFFSGQFRSEKILETDSNQELNKDSSFTLLKDLDVEPHKETEELKLFKKEIKEASLKHKHKDSQTLNEEIDDNQDILKGRHF